MSELGSDVKEGKKTKSGVSRRDFLKLAKSGLETLAAEEVLRKTGLGKIFSEGAAQAAANKEALNVPKPEIIEGIPTYGTAENPVDYVTYEAIRQDKNKKVENGEIVLEEDAIYAGLFVHKTTYEAYLNGEYDGEDLREHYGDNWQTFINTQVSEMNNMFTKGNLEIAESRRIYPTKKHVGLKIKKLAPSGFMKLCTELFMSPTITH